METIAYDIPKAQSMILDTHLLSWEIVGFFCDIHIVLFLICEELSDSMPTVGHIRLNRLIFF